MQSRTEAICTDLHNEEHLRKFRKHEKVVSNVYLPLKVLHEGDQHLP